MKIDTSRTSIFFEYTTVLSSTLKLASKGEIVSLEEIFENIAHRDFQDTTREESPLMRADYAIILDNTMLTEEEQLQFALDRIQAFIVSLKPTL